jgi:2-amino-4-hydroxy-6-hydroxymethyldihydropteridine diphosphokinase
MEKERPSTSSGRTVPWMIGSHLYAIALGSNRPHGRHGRPAGVIRAAVAALAELGPIIRVSAIHRTAAVGPAGRSFANAAAILSAELEPAELLRALKAIEQAFGRRPGRRWGPRVLDLDILLWSGGRYASQRLVIPHPHLARRTFVLQPLAEIAPTWRLPATALAVRHLAARLGRG